MLPQIAHSFKDCLYRQDLTLSAMHTPTAWTATSNHYLRVTSRRVILHSRCVSADADDCPASAYCNSDNECAGEATRPPVQSRLPAATPAVNAETHMPSTVPSAEPSATPEAYVGTPEATPGPIAEPAVPSVPTSAYNTHSGEACNEASRAAVLLIDSLCAMLHMYEADICRRITLGTCVQPPCQGCICLYYASRCCCRKNVCKYMHVMYMHTLSTHLY